MTWLITDLALRGAMVFAVVATTAWLLRGHSAAVRHATWAAGLAVGILLVPLALVRPVVRFGFYPQAMPADVGTRAPDPRTWPTLGDTPPVGATQVAHPRAIAPGPGVARSARAGNVAVHAIPWLWLGGTLLMIARIAHSRARLGQLRRNARPLHDGRLAGMARELGASIRLHREVVLLESAQVASPATFGILRPMLVLPEGARHWSAASLRVVLTHELAHVRRRDALTQLAGEVALALHWYQPLTWYAVDRLALERERACDDEVVEAGIRRTDYARHLVAMARRLALARRSPASALTLAEATGLHARLSSLLSPAIRRSRVSAAGRAWIAAHALVLAAAVACVTGSPPRAVARDRADAPPLARDRLATGPAAANNDAVPVAAATALMPATAPATETRLPMEPATEAHAPAILPLSDPLSERLANDRSRWPTEAEIAASPERARIRILQDAAAHEPAFAHDLVGERASWALGKVTNGELVAPLLTALADADWRAQAHAAWALAAVGATEAAAPIARLLDHPVWRVRAQAAAALLQLGAGLPADKLAALARDPAWQVRLVVVESLAGRRDPEALRRLAAMRDDPHTGTRIQVEAAIAQAQ